MGRITRLSELLLTLNYDQATNSCKTWMLHEKHHKVAENSFQKNN